MRTDSRFRPGAASRLFSRRQVLGAAAAGAALLGVPGGAAVAVPSAPGPRRLVARPARAWLAGPDFPPTVAWTYDGTVPGPEIRVRQGERLEVEVENRLGEPTTVHWHGVRLPLAMDGVPGTSQPAIRPGERFTYAFAPPDAGTFWYHPHVNGAGQVGRGLVGALIVEEREPPRVDRDVTWVLSDWRLTRDAAIDAGFGRPHDLTHAGRIGNTVTVNGQVREGFAVRAGERIRLRLVNAASARVFSLGFEGHSPAVVALDGHPVDPHEPEGGRVVLGPGMRADLILDMTGAPGSRSRVVDDFYARSAYRLIDLVYAPEPPLRAAPEPVPSLARNPVPEPEPGDAQREALVLEGGMMGGVDIRPLMARGLAWTLNGQAMGEGDHAAGHAHAALFSVRSGRTCVMEIQNRTAWPHPVHLHGHAFRVLSRNGTPTRRREWRDTVLLGARERVEIAFVAGEPGDWMLHCHVLEHQQAGMMGILRVL